MHTQTVVKLRNKESGVKKSEVELTSAFETMKKNPNSSKWRSDNINRISH